MQNKELPNLDLLRSMAVLMVVFSHIFIFYEKRWIGPFAMEWIGTAGVFIFFIHTALVLMWSLERRPHPLDFYIRRAFRIYPLALFAIFVAVLFHAPVSGNQVQHFSAAQVTAHMLVSNVLLIQNLAQERNINGVMWTLCLEVEMYIVLPMVFYYVRRNMALWPIVLLWMLACAYGRLTPHNIMSLVIVVPYFLSGVIAYVGFARRKAILPGWMLPIALIAFLMIFLLAPNFHRAWFLCLAIGLSLPSFRQIRSKALIRCTHEIAKYSYGIYLSHIFALVLGLYLMPHQPLFLQLTVIFSSTAILSVAGYKWLEAPMIRYGSRFAAIAERRYERYEATH